MIQVAWLLFWKFLLAYAIFVVSFHFQIEFKRIQSSLKHQTRCVAAFPNQQGFLVKQKVLIKAHWPHFFLGGINCLLNFLFLSCKVGSIEGRVGVHHLDESKLSKNYTFKCHRDAQEICSVNSINFHPVWYLNFLLFYFYFIVIIGTDLLCYKWSVVSLFLWKLVILDPSKIKGE